MSPIVCIVFLVSLVASVPHQLLEDADIVNFMKLLRPEATVDESLSTTLTPSEVNEKVKIRTRRDASLTIQLLEDSTSNLQNRSVCPWTYSIQTNSSRQPVELVQAACRTPDVPGLANSCEPVFYYLPIKVKQTSSTGGITWVDDLLKWQVGCTLARPRIQTAVRPNQAEGPTLS